MAQDRGDRDGDGGGAAARGPFTIRRLWPLAILLLGILAFFLFDLDRYVTFEALKQHREALKGFVQDHGLGAALIYAGVYAAAVAFSLPGGAVLSITGGFLFGWLLATVLVVFSATLGASLLFVIAKTTVGEALRARAGPWIKTMAEGFQEDAFNYLLVLRLVPIFPFFVVNLVPAFLGVPLRTYVLATFIGIIPGSIVYTTVGAGLGSIFDKGEEFTGANILTFEIGAALVGLAVLALIPVVYRKWKGRRP